MARNTVMPGRRVAEIGLLWLLPAALGLGGWLWGRMAWMTPAYLLYLLLAPALAMTLTVAVGAGALRMWRFTVPYAVRGVLPQIGLIYAAVINLVLPGLAGLLRAPGPAAALGFALAAAVILALLGVLYDLLAVHYGLLEVYVPAHYRGAGTWAIVRSYGFLFFGFVGLLAAIGARLGHWLLIERAPAAPWWPALALGVAAIALPCLTMLGLASRRRARRAARREASAEARPT